MAKHVERYDQPAADQEGTGQGAARVADFASGEGDIGPGGLREKRADHGLAEKEDQRQPADHRQTRLRSLRSPPVRPRIPPVRRARRAGDLPA